MTSEFVPAHLEDPAAGVGQRCGTCATGHYIANRAQPKRVRCVRCGHGCPQL